MRKNKFVIITRAMEDGARLRAEAARADDVAARIALELEVARVAEEGGTT